MEMNKYILGVWAALLVPFAIAGISGGPEAPWGHVAFHLGYIVAAAVAVILLVWMSRLAMHATVRRLSLFAAGAQLLFIAGQLGELLVIGMQHGPHAGAAALNDSRHDVAALALTAPGLLGSAVLVIALTVAVAMDRRRQSSATGAM